MMELTCLFRSQLKSTCCFLISPWDCPAPPPPPASLTAHSPFVWFPVPTLPGTRQCPCLLPPLPHYVLLTAALGAHLSV